MCFSNSGDNLGRCFEVSLNHADRMFTPECLADEHRFDAN